MSTSLILRGILAVIVGVLALAWPGVTILALIIPIFAIWTNHKQKMASILAEKGQGSAEMAKLRAHLLREGGVIVDDQTDVGAAGDGENLPGQMAHFFGR